MDQAPPGTRGVAAGTMTTAAQQGGAVAGTATEQTKEVAATAAQQTKEVAATAAETAKDVASTVKEQVGVVGQEAVSQARNLIHESRSQLSTQAEAQTEKIAGSVRQLGDQLQALTDGRIEEAGPVGDYARQIAGTVARYADQIEERGFEGIIQDVQRFARRRPGTFLLGAAIAGFGIGRILRNANAAQTDDVSSLASGQTMTPALPRPGTIGAAPALPTYDTDPTLVDLTDITDTTDAGALTEAPFGTGAGQTVATGATTAGTYQGGTTTGPTSAGSTYGTGGR